MFGDDLFALAIPVRILRHGKLENVRKGDRKDELAILVFIFLGPLLAGNPQSLFGNGNLYRFQFCSFA